MLQVILTVIILYADPSEPDVVVHREMPTIEACMRAIDSFVRQDPKSVGASGLAGGCRIVDNGAKNTGDVQ